MRIGILGGTFDPVHLGHLRVAEEIGEGLALDKVYLIPGGQPPHKKDHHISPFIDRLAMVSLAVEGAARLEALDLEGRRQGLSYSIETLRELHQRFPPGTAFFFLIGTDAFLDIKTWKDYRQLFDYTHFVVFRRPGALPEGLGRFLDSLDLGFSRSDRGDRYEAPSGNKVIMREVTSLNISSTAIREMVREGRSIQFLVTCRVREYILKRGLYRKNGNT